MVALEITLLAVVEAALVLLGVIQLVLLLPLLEQDGAVVGAQD